MPKDIKPEFLTGPRQLDEIMEKLEIIINEIMSDGGPVPMDLGNIGRHDVRTTQSDQDASNDMTKPENARSTSGTWWSSGLRQLGLVGSQSTVPRQNLKSQCLQVWLGLLGPERRTRPMPTLHQ